MAAPEPDTAIAKRPRGRPRKASYGPATLLPADWLASDDIAERIRAGNARLDDATLSQLCGITPAMVYALRDIAEGRNPSNGVRAADVIEAFEKMARFGHAPAKGAAKAPDAASQKSVVFVINVAERRDEIAAASEPKVIDVAVSEQSQTPPMSVALTVRSGNADG